jgi:hypothetical protein
MRSRANLLILLGGVLLAIFYATPAGSILTPHEDGTFTEKSLLGPFELVLPWIKLGGFALVGCGLALKLVARTRKRRSD